MRMGKDSMRVSAVLKCCHAKIVVGARIAHCLPPITHLNAARSATSVLPTPTSPQSRRSIGHGSSISCLMSAAQVSWSGVSS